jgi:choline-sulfatase
MADQLAPRMLGCHGGPARTPTLDALAAGGVVFDDAWCNSPLCTPSRTVLMTGLLPSRTGAFDNAAEFPAGIPTFAHHLRRAGYRTTLSGKMHFVGPDQLHGFEERLTTDIYPAALGWTPDWSRPDERPEWYHTMDSVTQAGPCVRTNQIDFDEEAVFWARRHLFDIARGNDRRPFCLVVSLSHPHDPYTIPEPWWSRHADHDVPEVAFPDLPDDDPHARRLAWVIGLGQQTPTPERIRAARRAYLGALAFVDDQFGAVLRTLREARLDDDTVVIVTSDHGDFLGEHGLWFKMSFRPEAARVPLIVHAPRRFASRRVAASVSLADLAPTLCELAGVAVEDALDGRGLIGHLSGLGGHDEVIGEYFAEGAVAPMGMIRRAGTTFVRSPGDPDQILGDGDAAALAAEAARRWDFAGLDAVVRTSQRRRALAAAALRQGARTSWDWQPPRDAGRAYVREHLDLNDIEAMARFPRV